MYFSEIIFNKPLQFEVSRESQKEKFDIKHKFEYRVDRTSRKIGARPWKYTEEKVKVEWDEFTLFKKGFKLDLSKITVIVGDNGCGKTTLLHQLKYKSGDIKDYISNEQRNLKYSGVSFRGVLMLDNLHKSSIRQEYNLQIDAKQANGSLTINEFSNFWNSGTHSNGETILDAIKYLSEIKNTIIILDEPETSLSLKSIGNLVNMLLKMDSNQLIISTHHPLFMRMVDKVFDLESKKFVKTSDYLKSYNL